MFESPPSCLSVPGFSDFPVCQDLDGAQYFPRPVSRRTLSAWIGGRLGGLISTSALALGTAYYHMPPAGFAVGDTADLIRLATFTISGAFVAWLSGALKENQRTMTATLTSIGDAVIATDSRGCVRFINPVAQTLTGWSQARRKEGRSPRCSNASTHRPVKTWVRRQSGLCGVSFCSRRTLACSRNPVIGCPSMIRWRRFRTTLERSLAPFWYFAMPPGAYKTKPLCWSRSANSCRRSAWKPSDGSQAAWLTISTIC